MGNGASIPESLDQQGVKDLVGSEYDEELYNSLKNEEGLIFKAQLLEILEMRSNDLMKIENKQKSLDTDADVDGPTCGAAEIIVVKNEIIEKVKDPVLDEELRIACGKVKKGKKSNSSTALQLIIKGADPQVPDEDGWTALFYAAGDGLPDQTRMLMDDCKVNLDTVDTDGCTALWNAAYNNQRHTATLLLSRGADLELKGIESGSHGGAIKATMAARRNNNPGLADLLDAETRLREKDPTRLSRLISRELSDDEFLHTLKAEEITPSN